MKETDVIAIYEKVMTFLDKQGGRNLLLPIFALYCRKTRESGEMTKDLSDKIHEVLVEAIR